MQSILGQDHESHFVEPPLAMESREASAGDISITDQENKPHEPSCGLRGRTHQRQQDDVLPLDDKHSASPKQRSTHAASRSLTSSANSQRQSSGSLRRPRKCGDLAHDIHAAASSQPHSPQTPLSRASSATKRSAEGTRGHARDPLAEEHTYLFIGPSTYSGSLTETSDSAPDISEEPEDFPPPDPTDPGSPSDTPTQIVSESPGAAEFEIYETAYRQEVERIRERGNTLQTSNPTLYLTRRVEGKDDVLRLVGDASPPTGNTRSATAPAIGAKIPFHSAAQTSGISGIKAQLENIHRDFAETTSRPQHSQPSLDPSAASIPNPSTSSCAASGTNSNAQQPGLENSRTKLLDLLGRVKSGRNP